MKKKLIQYAVWQDGENEQYFNYYDRIDEAIGENGISEIYLFEGKSLGKYRLKTVKVKEIKSKTKKK